MDNYILKTATTTTTTTEDQMEMMMMMELDHQKLSQSFGGVSDHHLSELSFMDMNSPTFFHDPQPPPPPPPHVSSSSSSSSPSSVPFPYMTTTNLIQKPHLFPDVGLNKFEFANPFSSQLEKRNSMAAMREMIFRIAAMQPIQIDPETVKPPKRRNVKISKDPQSVAARHRRERISEKIRILQRLVPGGTKMDTASMLDEAIHYVKFLKKQVQNLERVNNVGNNGNRPMGIGFPATATSATVGMGNNVNYSSFVKACLQLPPPPQMVGSLQMLR